MDLDQKAGEVKIKIEAAHQAREALLEILTEVLEELKKKSDKEVLDFFTAHPEVFNTLFDEFKTGNRDLFKGFSQAIIGMFQQAYTEVIVEPAKKFIGDAQIALFQAGDKAKNTVFSLFVSHLPKKKADDDAESSD